MAKKKTTSTNKTNITEKVHVKDEAVTSEGTAIVASEEKDPRPSYTVTDHVEEVDDVGGDEEEEEEEEEMVYLQVDTGDIIKLKQVLDEAVAGSVLQAKRMDGTLANTINLPENRTYDNRKLVLMSLACIFALIAQFSPIPFPEHRMWVGFFCALYFVCSGILQYTITFIDKDCIFVTQPLAAAAARGTTVKDTMKKNQHPLLTQYGLRFRSSLPRFSEFYTLIIEFHGMEKQQQNDKKGTIKSSLPPFVKQTWSVGKFFDKDGMFDEYGLAEEVGKLYRRLEGGNFDSENDVSSAKVKTH